MDSDAIRDKINIIKEVLDNCCFFCENELEDGSGENLSLPLCKICHSKYKLNRRLIERREMNGARWREEVRLIKEIFANRCFFCKNSFDPSKINEQNKIEEVDFLFRLCNASCHQKYRLFETWQSLGILSIQ